MESIIIIFFHSAVMEAIGVSEECFHDCGESVARNYLFYSLFFSFGYSGSY